MKKSLALFLALLTVAGSIVACANTNDPNKDKDPNKGNVSTGDVDLTKLNIDPSVSYNDKTVNISVNFDPKDEPSSYSIDYPEENIPAAYYDRQLMTEDYLDVVINPIISEDTGMEEPVQFEATVLSGTSNIHFVLIPGSTFFSNNPSRMAYLYNFADDSNLQLESEWWNYDSIQNLSYRDDTVKLLFGDIEMSHLTSASVIYFNKKMFTEIFKSSDLPYHDVLNKEWTIDKYSEYVSKGYKDKNGNQKRDLFDIYGAMSNPWHIGTVMCSNNDIRFVSHDEDGIPYLDVDLERAVNYAEKFYEIVWNNDGFKFNVDMGWQNIASENFAKGMYLFHSSSLGEIMGETFRTMESDFGILPAYMVDEEQEDYVSNLVSSWMQVLCAPITCPDPEMTTAVLETLAYYSRQIAIPVFYEAALRGSYVREELDSQVVEMVHDSIKSDYLNFFYRGGELTSSFFEDAVANNKPEFMSSWRKIEDKFKKRVERDIEDLIEADEEGF